MRHTTEVVVVVCVWRCACEGTVLFPRLSAVSLFSAWLCIAAGGIAKGIGGN